MFVIFVGKNEIIVTSKKRERKVLKQLFGKDAGRNEHDYERRTSERESVIVSSRAVEFVWDLYH